MKYQGKTSVAKWVDLWMGKFSTELAAKNIPELESRRYNEVVRKYLTENAGNPREIDLAKLKKFVTGQNVDAAPGLRIFYETVAPSEKHLEALDKIIGTAK
jgi:hypothetical protein